MTAPQWRVVYRPGARKDLRSLDAPIRQRVITAIDRLASGDESVDVKRLTGSDEYRLRVGDWRVRFRRDHDVLVITVVRVAHRSSVYDR